MKATSPHERGRIAYQEGRWQAAFEALASADQTQPLASEDLERLGRSAYMLGQDEEYVAAFERAHHLHLEAGDLPRAIRCGFWIGHSFMFRGEKARAAGWFARSERLLESVGHDCVERGWLRIPAWIEQMARGNFEGAYALTVEGVEIAERFGDIDLVWLARDDQARSLMRLGRTQEALRLVDEALITATSGELSPIVTGIVFCNTIAFCHARYEVRHVREWTDALTRWCERQPEMVTHNGLCLVHIANIQLLRGDWEAALARARLCIERFTRGALNRLAIGEAFYCQGEVHRLRGHFELAEEAYAQARQHGREPQPGLALLRLSQGQGEAAAATIRRVIGETTVPLARAGRLPAYVEIMLATGSLDLARAACRELDEICQPLECEVLNAMAAQARGSLALADGRAGDALNELRHALGTWIDLGAPYEIARVRVHVSQACGALGDQDTARLELEAARQAFESLGAARKAEFMDSAPSVGPDGAHGLTARELEVLRRVAAGKTNRDIAAELFISEHTVARHVQNIFAKLDVSSRTAATAFAFEHDLV